MGYVETLLRAKLDEHRREYDKLFWCYKLKHGASYRARIAELEFVIDMLNTSQKYQEL